MYARKVKRSFSDPEKVICYKYVQIIWIKISATNIVKIQLGKCVGNKPGRIPVVMSSESQIEAYSKLIYTIDMLYGDKKEHLTSVLSIPTAMVIFK